MARYLPFLYHDLIYVELPGLKGFLVRLADEDEDLAAQLITEAAGSIGQRRPARRALFELQHRSLERAARQRLYARAADLKLPFLTSSSDHPNVALPIASAAQDLRAAAASHNQLHRRQSLDRAANTLKNAQLSIAQQRRSGWQNRRRLATLRVWLDVVAEESAILAREEAERPQIPIPFVAGPALGADERELFKGRRDLIRIIDHDLTGDRRAPILLIGQRRMGKSSLLNMLPVHLGTGTRIASLNFQGLSGSPHREHPHRWIAEAIAETWPEAPAAPGDGRAWGETLAWLREVDAGLERTSERLLVALDEVERLEDGIRDGWASKDLLDLVRAAGDALYRVRFLLATAYPLPRLGPHWVDRLINVLVRQLKPLSTAEAEALILEPMPGFPDIYPANGVGRIVAATAGHPYLIQLVCDTLCRKLNEAERRQATDDDVEAAIDSAALSTSLFDELWRQRSVEERHVLQSLAAGTGAGDVEAAAARDLEREGYLTRRHGGLAITVPMFADWIAEKAPTPRIPESA